MKYAYTTGGIIISIIAIGVIIFSYTNVFSQNETPTTVDKGNASIYSLLKTSFLANTCIEERCFTLEIADTDQKRKKGLMYRDYIPSNAGMLFVFDEMSTKRYFRMKNVRVPLDMIRLDNEGQIVYIEYNAQPCLKSICPSYGPATQASQYVIELNGGVSQELGLSIGNNIAIETL